MKKYMKEWTIGLPWGKLAMVSWGNSTNPPILLMHGYMDSAATFIPLLELLPDKYYYVAYDLPGHGKSDAYPSGLIISQLANVEVMRIVVERMKWRSFAYISHSRGFISGVFYNHIYPGKISKMIHIDPVPPLAMYYYTHFKPMYPYQFIYDAYYSSYARWTSGRSRDLTYDEAINLVVQNRNLTEEQAEIVLSRSLVPVGDEKFRLSWDPRMKKIAGVPVSEETLYTVITEHTPPMLMIEASENKSVPDGKKFAANILDKCCLLQPNFSSITVPGGHDDACPNCPYISVIVNCKLQGPVMNCTPQCEWQIKAPWGFISQCWSCPASPLLQPPRLQSPASIDSPRHPEFNVISWGNPLASPVFLAHGRQDCAVTFQPLMQLMPTEEYYYVSIDMPGSGNSDHFPNEKRPINECLNIDVPEDEYSSYEDNVLIMADRWRLPQDHAVHVLEDILYWLPRPERIPSFYVMDQNNEFVIIQMEDEGADHNANLPRRIQPDEMLGSDDDWSVCYASVIDDSGHSGDVETDWTDIDEDSEPTYDKPKAQYKSEANGPDLNVNAKKTPDRLGMSVSRPEYEDVSPSLPRSVRRKGIPIKLPTITEEDDIICDEHRGYLCPFIRMRRARPDFVYFGKKPPLPPSLLTRLSRGWASRVIVPDIDFEEDISIDFDEIEDTFLDPTQNETARPSTTDRQRATSKKCVFECPHIPPGLIEWIHLFFEDAKIQRYMAHESRLPNGSQTNRVRPSYVDVPTPPRTFPRKDSYYENHCTEHAIEAWLSDVHKWSPQPRTLEPPVEQTYPPDFNYLPTATIIDSSVEAIHGSSTSAPEPSSPEQFSPRLTYAYELPRQEVTKSKAQKPENPGVNTRSTKFSKQSSASADRLLSADISSDSSRYGAKTINASAYVPQEPAQNSRPSQSSEQYFAPADRLLSGDRFLDASKSETQAYEPQDPTSGKFSAPDVLPSYYDQSISIWLNNPRNYAAENAQAYLPQDEAKNNGPSQSSRQFSVPTVLPPDFDQSVRIWLDDPLTYKAENVQAHLLQDAAEDSRPMQSSGPYFAPADRVLSGDRFLDASKSETQTYVPQDPTSGKFSAPDVLPSYYDQSISIWLNDPHNYAAENAQAYLPQDKAKNNGPSQSSRQFSVPTVLPPDFDQSARIWLDDPLTYEAENVQAHLLHPAAENSRPIQSSGQFSGLTILPSQSIHVDPDYYEAKNAQACAPQDPAKYSRPCQSSGRFSAPAVLPSYYDQPRRIWLDSFDDPGYSGAENAQAFVPQDPAKYSRPCQSSGQFSAPAVLPSYYEPRRARLNGGPSNIGNMSTDVQPGMYLYGPSYGPESFNDRAYVDQNFPVSDLFSGEDLFEISEASSPAIQHSLHNGVMVMRFHFVAAIEAAIEHLGWKRFIFMGHSMGAEVGLFYNCVYPGRITKMVLLDPELTFRRLQTGNLAEYQSKFYEDYYDNYWKYNNYFRTYTIPEATKAMMRARNLTEDKASIIVKRSLKHVKDDKYRFTWDRRLKMPAPQNYPNSYYFALFSNIPPSVIISATNSLNAKSNSGSLELLDMVCSLKNCRHVIVEGSHDVHLSHPERIAQYVVDFLRKNDSKL